MAAKARDIFNYIIALCLFVAAVVVLSVSTVTTIYYDMGCENDWPHYGRENIPMLALLVVLAFTVFYLLKIKGIFDKRYRVFIAAGLVFITAYCLLLILGIKPQAVNDSKTIDDIINAFMEGDYTALTQPGGYLFIWPFQLGYVGFGQIMYSIFGKSNYFAWDILQLLCILVTVYLIYRMTWEFFEDREICGITALLSCGALFFYNYVTYIYGDIISMAPQTLALYMMVLYVKRDKLRYAVISGISIAAAILIKTNCEITLIALLMILLGSSIGRNDGRRILFRNLVLALITLAFVFVSKMAVDAYFCDLTGLERIPEGSPSWSHIAMGLQESELEDGWYNGYNYHVFEENNYDTEATAKAAKENIRQTLQTFVGRPLHGARYMVRKFTTQWADSVCISTHNLDLVSRHVEDQPAIAQFLVFGTGSRILIWVMNVFMPLCYIGVAVYLFGILRGRKASVSEMLLLILIFGGIVFHEFWEGSSRYTMRYYIYYLPFGAYGLKVLLGFICEHIKRKI
ncbi:glycosyltransferase family 39 protein [Butyrivibrio sp. XPD2006]|uniref:glycosyltransferase family 39 protein n=1 Tax=Butyrivibrio sp. XPD2006 TaxID=1280668 RepID=UPI0003B7AF4C|nr:glycosyltransferase family 39 protein [Butyrivibrio sp. XPD2006]